MSSLKETMQTFAVNQALKYIEGDPGENLPKLMDMVDKFSPDDWYVEQRKAIRTAITEKNNWYQLVLKLYELDPGVRKAFFQNFLFNASFKGSAIQNEMKEKYGCNIPWAVLLDPTSACNLHCTGCWMPWEAHCSWLIMTISPSMTICSVPAPCWRIPRLFVPWSRPPVR